ncbi:MAG: ABC transporter substrate-binding protein [Chloroflexi bacterium]|nr:ABC transporter substrate-binding protein [Chloroflexota bacterium]
MSESQPANERSQIERPRSHVHRPWIPLLGLMLVVGLGALLWLALSTALGGGAAAADEVYARVVSSGVLRVGMDASFPPFESVDERQQLVGFDVDVANELAKRMSVRAEFVTTGFDALYPELAAQHYDVVVSALPYDRTRTQDVAYSDIYFRGGEVLVVRAEQSHVKELSDLNGQVVGVEVGTSAEALAHQLERRNGYRVQSYNSLEDAARALESRQIAALIADAISARLLRRAHAFQTHTPTHIQQHLAQLVQPHLQLLAIERTGQQRTVEWQAHLTAVRVPR